MIEIIKDVAEFIEIKTYAPPNNVEYQKKRLGEFFKSPIPINPIDASNLDLRLLYKTTVEADEYKMIHELINTQSRSAPPRSIALIGPPGCGKVFVFQL